MTMEQLDDRFEVLHALKVKGLAGDAVLAAMTGLPPQTLAGVVDALAADGFAVRREAGRMSGTMITPTGRTEHARLLADRPLTPQAAQSVTAFYDAFLPVNGDFKKVCSAWQLRADGSPNDHADADYDAAVIVDLGAIDERIADALGIIAGEVPRFGRYRARLAAALVNVQAGDKAAFARPMYDSYHDVWMELHQDLLLTAGRERGAGDE